MGGDSGSPGGGQHQHPHKGATPNRVLTHALGRGQQNRWESKQAGWALLIRHRQAAGRTLLEHWCWSPAVPCEAAALPAEPRLSIDCRHVGCLSRGAASGLLADAREMWGRFCRLICHHLSCLDTSHLGRASVGLLPSLVNLGEAGWEPLLGFLHTPDPQLQFVGQTESLGGWEDTQVCSSAEPSVHAARLQSCPGQISVVTVTWGVVAVASDSSCSRPLQMRESGGLTGRCGRERAGGSRGGMA